MERGEDHHGERGRPYASVVNAEPRRSRTRRSGESVAPPAGPVADFCGELHRRVRKCGVRQTEIAAALGLSASTVSGLLGGQRRTAPQWDAVRRIVSLCARSHGPGTPPGMCGRQRPSPARRAGGNFRPASIRKFEFLSGPLAATRGPGSRFPDKATTRVLAGATVSIDAR
ncbi:helix-turn-helix domain-containing protein [Streptomyces sp. NPDC002328]|uniref:helix-turn-helix domain-containing protein n=1 Tax=Streptomyces sp. NPDC002328 TaxID=3364642 RepID=UPI00369F7584